MIKGVRNIKYGEILSIVGELYREGETGTLFCQSGGTAKYLYIQGGQVIFAASNSFEDKFTKILLEEGKIKEEQLDMANQKKGNKTIAKTLTELGFISSADLIDSLIKQVYRITKSILTWEEGSATFKPDSLPPGVAKLPLSTQRLILDLANSIENRHYVMQIIGGIDKRVVIHKAELEVVLGLPLNPDEIKMANAANGERTIENISAIAQTEAFTTAKFFIGLHYLGLAHPKGSIESIGELERKSEVEKELDLSFLDKALLTVSAEEEKKPEEVKKEEQNTFQSIVPEMESFKPSKIEEEKEIASVGSTVEEPPEGEDKNENNENVVQPSLFSPTFLPPEEEKSAPFSEKPKITLSPLNPMPKRRRSITKIAAGSLGIMVILALIVFGILKLLEEDGQKVVPPPAVSKNTYSYDNKTGQPAMETNKKSVVGGKKKIEESLPKDSSLKEEQKKEEEQKVVAPSPPKEEKKTEEKKEMIPLIPEEEKTTPSPAVDPYESMIRGDYENASKAFRSLYSSKKGGFTIAIMLACEKDTITKAFAESNNSKDLLIFPYSFKGKNCFRVLWGYYRSREEAETAFNSIPKVFKDSGAKVVGFETMKQ